MVHLAIQDLHFFVEFIGLFLELSNNLTDLIEGIAVNTAGNETHYGNIKHLI